MKGKPILLALVVISAGTLPAQTPPDTAGERPPLTRVESERGNPTGGPREENQHLFAMGALVTAERARQVVASFREAYAKLGKPRLAIRVNRELVGRGPAPTSVKRTEHVESQRMSGSGEPAVTEKVTTDSTYEGKDGAGEPSLADRQTVRDVERLFGRPLRAAGATLVDPAAATALIAEEPYHHSPAADSPSARREREALLKVADVVIEVLISTRRVTVPAVAEDRTYVVPDIQATAIRLSDSAILGQSTARDVLGPDRDAAAFATHFDVNQIAEATALALMDDMAKG